MNGWDKYLRNDTFNKNDKNKVGKPYKVEDRFFSSSSVNYKSSISQKKIDQVEDAASCEELCKNELISVEKKREIDASEASDVKISSLNQNSPLSGTKIIKLER